MQEVRTTPSDQPTRSSRPAPKRLRIRLAVTAGVAAAAAAAISLVSGLTAPAWAVEHGPGDTITVRISDFRDPEGLEARLRAEGIPAIVDYIPVDKGCSRGDQQEAFPQSLDGERVFSGPREGEDTVFQFARSDLADGMNLSILAVTAPDQNEPVAFRVGVLPTPARHCELTDTPLLNLNPDTNPSPSAPSTTPTPTTSR